jgi:lactoylglutathione lyase
MLQRIGCVMFRVDDVDSAVAFYRDVTGLVPRWREGNQAGLEFPGTPGTELVLHSDPDIPAFDVNYEVEDVTAALPTLVEAGLPRGDRPVSDRHWQLRSHHRPVRQPPHTH